VSGVAPEWMALLRPRAGVLVDAAAGFLAWRGATAFPRGARGAERLVEIVEAWLYEDETAVDEETDRRFVEGAGALLGVLLIDHFGTAAYIADGGAHRVRLGTHGWIDPFGAIEIALDAPQPRAALSETLLVADAEARGDGPVARVLRAAEGAIERARPDLRIARVFDGWIELDGGIRVDLSRAIEATRDATPGAVARAVEKVVAMLPGGDGGRVAVPWRDAELLLVPRLVGGSFLALVHAGAEQRGEIATMPLVADVHVALLLAYDKRSRYVRADEVEDWAVPFEVARAVAIANLAARSARARFDRVDDAHGPMVVARTGDGLDAARLLLPGFHDVVAAELGSPFVVGVPHRDALVATAREREAAVDALRQRTRADAAAAPHRITDALLVVTRDDITALP